MKYIGLTRPSHPLAATLERIVKVSCNSISELREKKEVKQLAIVEVRNKSCS